LRTSSAEYSVENSDAYTHLTNNCLQIKNKDTYGKHEEGNALSFSQFQAFLNETYPEHNLDVDEHFKLRMKDLAIDCYLSAKTTLNPSKRRNGFELFGFDFMIDEDFRVWLIEVNTNPYIGIHNKSMKHLPGEMLDNLFKIVVDPIFDGHSHPEEIGWTLLYSRARGVNLRRPVQEGIYPVPELANEWPIQRERKKKKFGQNITDRQTSF